MINDLVLRCKGIIYNKVDSDATYTFTCKISGDYYIVARVNAKNLDYAPHIQILKNGNLESRNSGVNGSNVYTDISLSLNKNDIINIIYENIVINKYYNSYFILLMHKND